MEHPYETVASFLLAKTKYRPEVGIICGSGLSGLSETMTESETFKYVDIPGFPNATVAGHKGELVFGKIGNTACVAMRGRFHFYEGNAMEQVVMPVRVMRLMGVKLLIVTNAAGGLNPAYKVGDVMIIQDHFGTPCLAGNHPLRGHNNDQLGPRFPAMSDCYDDKLQNMVVETATALGLSDRVRTDGTYCFVSGPCYETKAESRFLRSIGGDSVGMSTVPEVIAAKHCGMKIIGLSLITNAVVTSNEQTVHASHQEVLDAVRDAGKHVQAIVNHLVLSESLKQYVAALPVANYAINKVPAASTTSTTVGCCLTSKNGCTPSSGCCSSGCGNTVVSVIAVAALIAGIFIVRKNYN